ncbi:MAG: EamA family transporter [Hyphomicrobiales bacterium]|nr:EamA family transporter [Hyphomicrobiales bacterium]
MPPRDIAAALLTAVVWGLSFIAIKIGVREAPPFLLAALRFFFAAFPAIFFIRPPKAPFALVALYGVCIGVLQFGMLFLAIKSGMPAGLASLVVQSQVFFTILLAALVFKQRPKREQIIGAAIALAGICVIGSARLGGARFLPFALTLVAAASWAAGNIVGVIASRRATGKLDALSFTVWSSLAVPLPMLAASFALESGTMRALTHPSLTLALCVAALAYGGTLLGFGLWSRLLTMHPAAVVTPFALLVPVVGMAGGHFVFDEPLEARELLGAALVMAGLAYNIFGQRLFSRARR